jgi:hypothetical protein
MRSGTEGFAFRSNSSLWHFGLRSWDRNTEMYKNSPRRLVPGDPIKIVMMTGTCPPVGISIRTPKRIADCRTDESQLTSTSRENDHRGGWRRGRTAVVKVNEVESMVGTSPTSCPLHGGKVNCNDDRCMCMEGGLHLHAVLLTKSMPDR